MVERNTYLDINRSSSTKNQIFVLRIAKMPHKVVFILLYHLRSSSVVITITMIIFCGGIVPVIVIVVVVVVVVVVIVGIPLFLLF